MPTIIERIKKMISDHEENLRLIEEEMAKYPQQDYSLKLTRDKKEIEEKLQELRSRLKKEESNTTAYQQSSLDLSLEEKVKTIHVNREEEEELFHEMLNGQTNLHILLIEAEAGMGKTLLLEQFWNMSDGFKRSRVDFKNTSYSMGQILSEMKDQYGQQSFPIFYEECKNLLSQVGHIVSHPKLVCAAIDVMLAKLPLEERQDHQRLVTNAFLADLDVMHDTIGQPIVMFFDTFEKASDSAKAWMAEQLINEIRSYPWLICVVTGRQVPRIIMNGNDWCLQHKLQPLSDKHAREYIQKVKYTQDEQIITFITLHAKGRPLTLKQLVLTLLKMN